MKSPSILHLLSAASLLILASNAYPQTTAFTYQGRLADNGAPATGNYDLRFAIYDAAADGNALGSPIAIAPVGVTNGLFTVTLDFGAGVFDGSARWLEIGVRTNGNAESHVLLSPRQPLTSAPYAVRAATAGTAASVSGMVPAAQVTGSIPASQIGAGTISSAVMFDSAGNTFNGTFAGNGAGLNQLALQNFTNFPPSLIALLNPPLLNGAATYAIGNNPHAVLAADVNADGQPDLISADQNSGTLTVLTNAGNGAFLPSASPTVGNQPLGVAAGDLNGDGRVDLISANYGGNSLTTLANPGNGTFGSPATLSVGVHPYSVVAADLNGDGALDLVCANEGSGTLTVLTNDGFGTFTVASSPAAGLKPQFVIVADVDADVRPDLISANHDSGTLTVLTNSGSGIFGVKDSPAVGASPSSVTAVDVNGDGKPDLVSANGYANTLTVLTNHGDGTFTVAAMLSPGGNPQSVAAADVNGDGTPDLVSANLGDNTLTVLINKGGGTFVPVVSPAVGAAPISVVASDLNGDGRVDLIAANGTGNSVSVLLARPDPLTLLAAGNGGRLTNVPAASLRGTLPNGALAGAYDQALTLNNAGNLFTGTFTGNGAGLTGLDANNLATGTLPDARLSANVALLAGGAGFNGELGATRLNIGLGHRLNDTYGSIAGGGNNTNDGYYAVLSGGRENTIQPGAQYALIGGGSQNTVQTSASYTTIGGGGFNTIETNGWYGTIAGGTDNTILTDAGYATIGGGHNNTVEAMSYLATIPGGAFNNAASFAFAAGYRAKANHTGSFVWADSSEADFASTSNNQFSARANGGVRFETAGAGVRVDGAQVVTSVAGAAGPGKLLLADTSGQVSWQPVSVLSGFLGQDYSALLPNVIDNTVKIDIESILVGESVVLINGPGLDIQRIAGFSGGNPDDHPGPNAEFPLVFEYNGPFASALLADCQQFTNSGGGTTRAISLIVNRLDGTEAARWNLNEMGLTQIEPGADGRTRYTYQHVLAPNNSFAYERVPASFGTLSSINPDTDGPRVEIEGLLTGPYPAVQINTNNRTVTLTFDYSENGEIYNWVKVTANGTGTERSMSLVYEAGGVEVARTNYYGAFPTQFQQFTGFGQYEKLKERVVVSYDVQAAAQ